MFKPGDIVCFCWSGGVGNKKIKGVVATREQIIEAGMLEEYENSGDDVFAFWEDEPGKIAPATKENVTRWKTARPLPEWF